MGCFIGDIRAATCAAGDQLQPAVERSNRNSGNLHFRRWVACRRCSQLLPTAVIGSGVAGSLWRLRAALIGAAVKQTGRSLRLPARVLPPVVEDRRCVQVTLDISRCCNPLYQAPDYHQRRYSLESDPCDASDLRSKSDEISPGLNRYKEHCM
jgi:hypothetical protein